MGKVETAAEQQESKRATVKANGKFTTETQRAQRMNKDKFLFSQVIGTNLDLLDQARSVTRF